MAGTPGEKCGGDAERRKGRGGGGPGRGRRIAGDDKVGFVLIYLFFFN